MNAAGSSPIRVESVNLGKAGLLKVRGRDARSGIFKFPVEGRVAVTCEGLSGDEIANLQAHGGPDQAVYLYSREDYDWWSRQLGRQFEPATFGENLTIRRWWPEVRIGDRLRFSDLLLEITAPRIPCATLQARMEKDGFLKDFVAARRPGYYARVLEPGTIGRDDRADVICPDSNYVSALQFFDIWHAREWDREQLQSALRSPLAARLRRVIEYWLTDEPRAG